ncbi:hypothetical protein ACWC10_06495 [Streptomyces sp. NPDC001595]
MTRHRARSGPSGDDQAHDPWLTVTVELPPVEVRSGGELLLSSPADAR